MQAAALGENLRAVRELLGSVKGAAATTSVRHRVLEAYSSMATGQRADAEQALSGLLEVANKNRDHVPTLLAIATAFVILRQKPKARNQLKRISKLPYSLEHGSEFEVKQDVLRTPQAGGILSLKL